MGVRLRKRQRRSKEVESGGNPLSFPMISTIEVIALNADRGHRLSVRVNNKEVTTVELPGKVSLRQADKLSVAIEDSMRRLIEVLSDSVVS